MQKIERQMESTISGNDGYNHAQASLNSDGRIVMRLYDSLDNDVIFVFSQEETNAIFELFRIISRKLPGTELPF